MSLKIEWPNEIKKRAREIYVSYTGPARGAVEYTRQVLLREYTTSPHNSTINRWAHAEGWEDERQRRIKASIVDQVAASTAKAAEDLNPADFMTFLKSVLERDIGAAETDRQIIQVFQERILQMGREASDMRELANALIAVSRAADAKMRRATVIGTILRAIGEALQARAEAARVGTCPAITGGPIPEGCPIIARLLGEDEHGGR